MSMVIEFLAIFALAYVVNNFITIFFQKNITHTSYRYSIVSKIIMSLFITLHVLWRE